MADLHDCTIWTKQSWVHPLCFFSQASKQHRLKRYHSQTYVNGSKCDLNGNPRETEVRVRYLHLELILLEMICVFHFFFSFWFLTFFLLIQTLICKMPVQIYKPFTFKYIPSSRHFEHEYVLCLLCLKDF